MRILIKNYFIIFVLIGLSFLPLTDLLHPGLPITHDGQDHIARIANFYQNLLEGNIIPRWAGNLNWGYGHPILEFLYPLPSYFASFFHFLGFTLVDSVKIVFGTSFILSGMATYIFIKELLRDEKVALLAGLLYVIAPYRFVDLYVRGAIGEHVAFIFPPLILYFLNKLSKSYSYLYIFGGSLSFAGLVLSHNAITLMFLPLIFLYILYLLFQTASKKLFIFNSLILIFIGFGLSAFFWIPAFIEGKYTLRDIVTGGGEYAASFVAWKDFFDFMWSYGGSITLSKQIGIVHWLGVFGSIIATYYLYINKNRLWLLATGAFIILTISLFLMTNSSTFLWQSIATLQKFQFPWRFLSITVFISALLGAIAMYAISNKLKTMFLIALITALLLMNKDYWRAHGYLNKPEIFFTGIYDGTTDTGESSPIWSVRFMEKRPVSKVEVIDGKGTIREIKRNFTQREYKVESLEKIRVLENTLYFPGWTVLVDGKIVDIQFQDPQFRGLMTFFVDKGKHNVEVKFGETKLRTFADIISAATLAVIIFYLAFGLKKKYNKKANNPTVSRRKKLQL